LMMIVSSATGGTWTDRTDFTLDKISKVILFGLMMGHVVVTSRRTWQIALLFVVMALYLGHEATNAPPGAFTNNRLDGIGGPDFRESAGLAIHLFALLPFVAVVFLQKNVWLKVLAFLAGCYAVNGILLCRARSAFVAGVIVGVTAIWYIPRRYRRWVVGMLVLGCIGGFILSDSFFWNRMTTIFNSAEERDNSATSRLEIWSAAWLMVKDNPFGVGIGQFRNQIGRYASDDRLHGRDAHNSFVLCAAETGVLGLSAYLGALTIAWLTLGRANRRLRKVTNRDRLSLLIFANRLALLVYIIGGLFVSRFYTEGAWLFVILPACLDRAVENEIRVEVRQTTALLKQVDRQQRQGVSTLAAT